jgi:hypothetical protein
MTRQDPNAFYTDAGATGYTLFGPNGPSYTDVAQGSAGDCWLLASLGETAARDPNIIQNMFINDGNGIWTVRFYVNGAPDYVTVNDQLPLDTVNPSYNGGYAFDAPQNGILWVALAEKAYAQENLSGQISTSQPGSDSYAALNGGFPSWALPTITGLSSNLYYVTPGLTAESIATALEEGELVCICTPSNSSTGQNLDIDPYLVAGHCYAVVGYNPSSSMPFEVFNPSGINTYSDTGGQTWGLFTSNGAFLEENFAEWGVAGTTAPGSGSRTAMLSADSLESNAIPSTQKPLLIGFAPTSAPSQVQSIGRRHGHQDLALGSLVDEDLEFLRS